MVDPTYCNVSQHIAAPNDGLVHLHMYGPSQEPDEQGTELTACLVDTEHRASQDEAAHKEYVLRTSSTRCQLQSMLPQRSMLCRSARRAFVPGPAISMLVNSDQKLM
jgi:hypothetical protein